MFPKKQDNLDHIVVKDFELEREKEGQTEEMSLPQIHALGGGLA